MQPIKEIARLRVNKETLLKLFPVNVPRFTGLKFMHLNIAENQKKMFFLITFDTLDNFII